MDSTTTRLRTSPKDFFLHLATMVALYVSSISLLALLFQMINISFPDRLDYYVDPYSAGIRWAIACLIIIFPLYILFTWLLNKEYARIPEKRDLGIRKWLVFLTLFVAGIAIITDLVVLINTFLGGEITVRFILKVVSVLVVTGIIFGYYIYDLRKVIEASKLRTFAIVISLLVLVSIIFGFVIMGSPTTQRLKRFDDRKVSDLQTIQWQAINYWQLKQKLPANLDDLSDPLSNFVVPTDPQTSKPYTYQVVSPLKFKLCADFNAPNKNLRGMSEPYYPKPMGVGENETWQHEKGNICFDRTIDPELYPPVPKPVR